MEKKPKPIAVLISDVHYSLSTLELADKSMKIAISKANELDVPLIVAGDLHDTKANLRGECINAMRATIKLANKKPYVLIGNHDRLNEKTKGHSLSCLEPLVNIVEDARFKQHIPGVHLVAYHHDPEELRKWLSVLVTGSILILHQGLEDANSGHYIQDKSAIRREDVKDFRIISGHYHQRQDIKTGRPRGRSVGLWSYIGNPYTLNYAEANDPPKGFQILMDDGSLEFVPTNLRKHMVYNFNMDERNPILEWNAGDLVWAKVAGTREQLLNFNKDKFTDQWFLPKDCRLDLIPTDIESANRPIKNLNQSDTLDNLIDSITNTTEDRKDRLKKLWKDLV